MRVKLRDDLMYVPTEDGVYLETGTANTQLHGAAAYRLIQRMAPHLDGSRTVEALTASLPAAQRQLIADMARMLVERGIARDLDSEPPHTLQDWELRRYRESIAFAEHATDAPLSRFEAFRDSRVLLVGGGHGMLALVSTLFELGLRTATLIETVEQASGADAYRRILEQHRDHDPTADLLLSDAADDLGDDARLAALLDGHDVVLHCADRAMAERALRLNRIGRACGVAILHAIPDGGQAWIGPTGGGVGGCWECGVHSRRGARPAGEDLPAGDQPDVVPQWLTPPVGGLVGAALAFDYLRHSMGAETTATNRLTRVDLESAVTSGHLIDVHPRCVTCRGSAAASASIAERISTMRQHAAIELDTFVAQAPYLVDVQLGPLLAIGPGPHSQISVSCVEATVVDLTGSGAGPTALTAVGPTRKQALTRAAVAAMELLAAAARVPSADTTAQTDEQWWDPLVGEPVSGEPDSVELAGGLTWAEACGRAVLKLLRAAAAPPRSATGPAADDPPGDWLDPACWPQPVQVLSQELALLGHHLRAWRDASSTPTVFVGADGRWLAHSCAPSSDIALEHAAQAAVAALTGRPPTGAEIGPDLGDGAWDALLPSLLREVAEAGQRLALRPADDLDAVRRVLPFIVEAALLPNARSAV